VRAAVCRDFGRPLSIEHVELGEPHAGEVRVAIRACGICHSDLHSIDGAWGGDLPAIFGHEAAGIIEHVGEGIEGLRPGQHVVVTLIRACRRCLMCSIGQPALCEGSLRLDAESPIHATDGTPIRQGVKTGAFAESVLVDASQVVPIPDEVPFASGCLLACAVLTGFGAVVNTARVESGASVVVIGAGGVGLNAIQAAALAGAARVIAIDIAPAKLQMAPRFGATDTIDGKQLEVGAAVRDLTNGKGADVVVVTAGSGLAVEQGMKLARRAGTVVVVGMPPVGEMSRIDPMQVAYYGQRIVGSKMGSATPQVDIPRLVMLYRAGRLKLDELVTNRYPLAAINDGIAAARAGDSIRSVVVMQG
jgi:S-(hydroxymethyl)glutathione dehydrogenase / alcohol dehydrogenase